MSEGIRLVHPTPTPGTAPNGAIPRGVYKTTGGTGWAAYDKDGRTWRVNAEQAASIQTKKASADAKAEAKAEAKDRK